MFRMVIALMIASLVSPAFAGKAKLAVMPLAAKNTKSETVEIITELVTGELAASGRYEVIGVSDINAMLGLERMKDAAGCSDVACAAEIGGALGVRFMVTGSVGRMGGELLVQLSMIDVMAGKAASRGRGIVKDEESLYRRAVETATAELLGMKVPQATPTTSVGTGKKSPARFQFDTTEPQHEFDVKVTAMDGGSHQCNPAVRRSASCMLSGLSVGEARLSVSADELTAFLDEFTVQDSDELFAIQIETRASPGAVISWTFGGLGLAAGAALVGVGLGMDEEGLLYGGIPAAAVGAGLLILGFVFERKIDVDYPGIDAFF